MAGENLLHQGGAGARHAHYEDRRAVLTSVASTSAQQRRVEDGAGLDAGLVSRLRVIGQQGAAQGIPACVMIEGIGRLAAVLASLAQGKVQVKAVFGPQFSLLQLALHLLKIFVIETRGLQIGETPPRLTEARRHFDRTAIRRDSFTGSTNGFQRVSQAQPDVCCPGLPLEEALVDHYGLGVFAESGQDRGLQQLVVRLVRCARDETLRLGKRGLGFLLPL